MDFACYYVKLAACNSVLSIIAQQMFNFGSGFNPLRNAQSASLAEQLTAPNATLLRLLDDDNFQSEFRSGSAQVRQFMNYRRLQEMLELVTVEGDPADKKRSYKFPLLAADLLSGDAAFVIEKLLPEEGVVVEEEQVVSAQEQEVQQEVEEDDEELEFSSSESSREERPDDKEAKSEQKTCAEEEEEFGEFVATPVRPKRTVKVKQVVQTVTVVKKEHCALINKLLEYFSTDINYTLTSYCCKVLTSLLNKRTSKFLDKLFENQHYVDAILTHIESRSTVELLTRIFTVENSAHLNERVELFKRILQSSSFPKELGVMSNIAATLCETFEKLNANAKTISPCKELQVYYKAIPEMLEKTVSNILSEHETVCVYSVGFIFTLLNSLPAQLDGDAIDSTLSRFVDGMLAKLSQAMKQKKSRLGVGRVRMLEVLNFIMKRVKIREYLSRKDFFPILFSIIKQHPLNNILHNEAFKAITTALTSEKDLIAGGKFIDWLYEETEMEMKRVIQADNTKSIGYAGHLLQLCKKIKELSATNPIITQLTYDSRFTQIYSVLVERPTNLNDLNLGGYAIHTQRVQRLKIMCSREQILKYYQTFLANARPPVFESDPDLPNPILLEELQRQLDGVQFESIDDSRPKEVIEQEKHKAELIEENEHHKSAFWKMHLQYDVDDLMDQML